MEISLCASLYNKHQTRPVSDETIISLLLPNIANSSTRANVISELKMMEAESSKTTLDDFVKCFLRYTAGSPVTYKKELKAYKWDGKNSLIYFYNSIRRLVIKAYSLENENIKVIDQISSSEFRSKLPRSIGEAAAVLSSVEVGMPLAKIAENVRCQLALVANGKETQEATEYFNNLNIEKNELSKKEKNQEYQKLNYYNDNKNNYQRGSYQQRGIQRGSFQRSGPQNSQRGRGNETRGYHNSSGYKNQNYNSGQNGNRSWNPPNIPSFGNTNNKAPFACHYCNRQGHSWRECRTLKTNQQRGTEPGFWNPKMKAGRAEYGKSNYDANRQNFRR